MAKTKTSQLQSLPSKKHSCSELEKGHRDLIKVKKEHYEPDELAKKIQEWPYRHHGADSEAFWTDICTMVKNTDTYIIVAFHCLHTRSKKRKLQSWRDNRRPELSTWENHRKAKAIQPESNLEPTRFHVNSLDQHAGCWWWSGGNATGDWVAMGCFCASCYV